MIFIFLNFYYFIFYTYILILMEMIDNIYLYKEICILYINIITEKNMEDIFKNN